VLVVRDWRHGSREAGGAGVLRFGSAWLRGVLQEQQEMLYRAPILPPEHARWLVRPLFGQENRSGACDAPGQLLDPVRLPRPPVHAHLVAHRFNARRRLLAESIARTNSPVIVLPLGTGEEHVVERARSGALLRRSAGLGIRKRATNQIADESLER